MSRAKKSRSLTPHVSHPLQTLVYLWIPRDYRIAGVIRRLKPAIRFPFTLYSSSYRVLLPAEGNLARVKCIEVFLFPEEICIILVRVYNEERCVKIYELDNRCRFSSCCKIILKVICCYI